MAASAFRSNVPVPVVSYSSTFTNGTVAGGTDLIASTIIDRFEHSPLSLAGPNFTQRVARIQGEYQAGITTEFLSAEYYGRTIYCWRVLRPSYFLVRARMAINMAIPTDKPTAERIINAMELKLKIFEGDAVLYSPLKIGLPDMDPHDHGDPVYDPFYYPINMRAQGGNSYPTPPNAVDRRALLWASNQALFTFERGPDEDEPIFPNYGVTTQFYRLCDQQNFLDWTIPAEEEEDA